MFERNKIDAVEQQGIAVEMTTDTGDTLGGKVLVARGKALSAVLNSTDTFVDFEPWGGERVLIAKATIRSIKPVQIARPESLASRAASADAFDPYTILGVKVGASLEEVKGAWHRLSMAYHPDRYASAELPSEVLDYLAAMVRRINAAYAALEAPLQARRRALAGLRATEIGGSRTTA
jgi:hypothetical protein